jgi:hypothetical protein
LLLRVVLLEVVFIRFMTGIQVLSSITGFLLLFSVS